METSEKDEGVYLLPLEEVLIKQEYNALEDWTNTCEKPYHEQGKCQTEIVHEIYIKEELQESIENEDLSLLKAKYEDHVSMINNDEQQSLRVKQEDLCTAASSDGQLLQRQCKIEDIYIKEEPENINEVEDWSFTDRIAQNNHMLPNESKKSITQLNDTVDSEFTPSVCTKKKSIFERRYQCTICKQLFKQSSILKKHILNHDQERPFQCLLCEKNYKTACGLRRHKVRHTGERKYQCQFCEKRFGNNSYYKEHLRLHTGEKPFQCKYCKTRFTMRVYMKKHESICKERTEDLNETN